MQVLPKRWTSQLAHLPCGLGFAIATFKEESLEVHSTPTY